jgi:acyl carrier protein
MSELRERLQDVFRNVFDDDEMEIFDGMSAAHVEDWDSLQHINLIIAVEKTFGISFTVAEISQLKEPGQNVGTFTGLIERKVASRSGGA